ncbi:hypothetical protein DFJ74DRAFT_209535 [Hyaloraphidium curvatum]|nr:hypothetical protein DFJ74DRAFT_209535 [Hyaloraphidium curvatum]
MMSPGKRSCPPGQATSFVATSIGLSFYVPSRILHMEAPSDLPSLLDSLPPELVVECLLCVVPTGAGDAGSHGIGGLLPQLLRLSRACSTFAYILVPRAVYQLLLRRRVPLVVRSEGFKSVAAPDPGQPDARHLFHLQLFARSFDEGRRLIEFGPWEPWMGNEPPAPAWMGLPDSQLLRARLEAVAPESAMLSQLTIAISQNSVLGGQPSGLPWLERATGQLLLPRVASLNSAKMWLGDFPPQNAAESGPASPIQLPFGIDGGGGAVLEPMEAVRRAAQAFHSGFNIGLDRIFVVPDAEAREKKRFFGDSDVLVEFRDAEPVQGHRSVRIHSAKVTLSFLSLGYGQPNEQRWVSRGGLLTADQELSLRRGMEMAASHSEGETEFLFDPAEEGVLRYTAALLDDSAMATGSTSLELPKACVTPRALLFHFLRNPSPGTALGKQRMEPHPTHAAYKYSFAKRFIVSRPTAATPNVPPSLPGPSSRMPHQPHLANPSLAVAHAIIKSEKTAAGIYWMGGPAEQFSVQGRPGGFTGPAVEDDAVSWWGAAMRLMSPR